MVGLNKKGFTLIELLAVLVILSAIMGIALPSITSSLERNKTKQNDSKKDMLESFAEIYVMDHKNAIYSKLDAKSDAAKKDVCYILVTTLENEGYLSDGANEDADGNAINGNILFDRSRNLYVHSDSLTLESADGTLVSLDEAADKCL